MNVAAYAAISSCETANYVGPINPPPSYKKQLWSKLHRLMGSQGSFSFFSEQRLQSIAAEVHSRCQDGARLDFFHGFTPWTSTRPKRPYVAWSDCTFHDYIDIYHSREQFRRDDLERIEQTEAEWLRKADRVLFTSDWAVERALRQYSLDADRVTSVGIFGEVNLPSRDTYGGGQEFVFVSTNFVAKGGPVVLTAFHEVRQSHPEASLVIVGDPVKSEFNPGVRCTGFLRKEVPSEYQQFRQILAGARAIVSATRSDICPLAFVEAGYFGCPVISIRRFAIPEIVDHGMTGLLLDCAQDPTLLARAMCQMLDLGDEYSHMREAAWLKARSIHTKERFEAHLRSCLGLVTAVEKTEFVSSR